MTTDNFWRQTFVIASLAVAAVALSGCSMIDQVVNTVSDAADPGEGTTENIFSVGVGDCEAVSQTADEVDSTRTIDCSEPHATEFYAVVIVPDGDFPEQDAMYALGDAECLAAFESYIGVNYDDSIYDFSYYSPSTETWASGDREILCYAYDYSGAQIAGSVAGVGR
ncbi:septum formation family protein [Salinibacterium sp. M195]|uniref:septum formation family protein n=1 Tax=Salinibacterium sp. M195 TaxID=2583374 RepID=UPI001C63299B|nr:septum formation family protein [Salinibacterium sp. M195]QYH36620.1 hypothetical protein FFT87_12060 [Salinibacterium sp. M195]